MTWLAHLFGVLGILAEWRAYLFVSGVNFRRWSALGSIFWAIMYFLLEAYTASLVMLFTSFRTIASYKIESKRARIGAFLGFSAVFVLLGVISWQGWISLLPVIAIVNNTLALFLLNNLQMRVAFIVSTCLWIVHDLYWKAWVSIIAEMVGAFVNIATILTNWRYFSRETA